MKKVFEHQGKTYEIRVFRTLDSVVVSVYLDNKRVSLNYSASCETESDLFVHSGDRITDKMIEIAEDEVRNGLYL